MVCSTFTTFTLSPPSLLAMYSYCCEKLWFKLFLHHYLLTNGLMTRCRTLLLWKLHCHWEHLERFWEQWYLPSRVVKELFSHSLSGNVAYIMSDFGDISSTITVLAWRQLVYNCNVQGDECQRGQAHDNGGMQNEVQTWKCAVPK